MIVGLGAHAEGGFISAEAAVIAAKADLQAYGGLTGGELDSFTFESDGVEDRSDKGMGMVRCVHAVYDAHPGLPDLRLAHFISATDGKVVARFDSPFRDGRDFAGYYRDGKYYSGWSQKIGKAIKDFCGLKKSEYYELPWLIRESR